MTLVDDARRIRDHAYAPYSKFKVGAALRTTSGNVYVGVNVENAAYPEGTCAEAGAIAAMIAGGDTEIAEIAIIADCPEPLTPCGGCRQKLAEFGKPDTRVVMTTMDGKQAEMSMAELLPGAFGAAHMGR